jgi:hypothetical protein
MIESSFNTISVNEKEHSIRRFALYWRLLLTNNNINEEKLHNINYSKTILIMLGMLENDNPLIRNASKAWLLESEVNLYRIIDSLLFYLVEISKGFIYEGEFRGALYYFKVFDTEKVNNTFRKFRTLVKCTSDLFIKYISNTYVS